MKTRKLLTVLTLASGLMAGCADQSADPVSLKTQMARAEETTTLTLVDVVGAESNAEFVLIDKNGGIISDDENGHQLIIPRNAVQEPTYFTMGTLGISKVVVNLMAFRARDLDPVTRFPKGLTLRLNYAKASVGNPHQLKIVYVSSFDLEILEVFPTKTSGSGPYVEAQIYHFSSYSMALD